MQGKTFVFFWNSWIWKGDSNHSFARLLKQKYNLESLHAYPGNEYRKITASDTQTASLVKETLEKGKLQPDFFNECYFYKYFN